jgi:hypothetical protein
VTGRVESSADDVGFLVARDACSGHYARGRLGVGALRSIAREWGRSQCPPVASGCWEVVRLRPRFDGCRSWCSPVAGGVGGEAGPSLAASALRCASLAALSYWSCGVGSASFAARRTGASIRLHAQQAVAAGAGPVTLSPAAADRASLVTAACRAARVRHRVALSVPAQLNGGTLGGRSDEAPWQSF